MKNLIRILQIGDVHFPEGRESDVEVDHKDDGVSKGFAERISTTKFRASTRKMVSVLSDNEIDFITFMGDLTTRGDLGGYDDCLKYLAKGMRFSKEPLIDTDNVMVVAGNHDVDRDTAISNPSKKFSVLNKLLQKNGFKSLTESTVDHRKIIKAKTTILRPLRN